jgi:phosphoribosylanthranilate isomerase
MTLIKVCGITSIEAGLTALDAGASYLGFVFYPPSIRLVTPEGAGKMISALREAHPAGWQAVGVFVNESLEKVRAVAALSGLDVVQLNGEEPREYVEALDLPVFKAVRIGGDAPVAVPPSPADFAAERLLVDASVPGQYGGTGVSYDWTQVRPIVVDGFVAGGLTPTNVGAAIAAATPWGVDVSSGVERGGVKNPKLIRAFLEAVRQADAALVR